MKKLKSNEDIIIGVQESPECTFGNLTVIMTRAIENFFYRLGHFAGKKPWVVILTSLAFCGICASGLSQFYVVSDDDFLWSPYGSDAIKGKEWIDENYPKDSRTEVAIMFGTNVLAADYMRYLLSVIQEVSRCNTTDGEYTFEDLCIKNPESPGMEDCYVDSVLKIWNNDEDVIMSLTDEEVIHNVTHAVNEPNSTVKPMFSNLVFDENTGLLLSADAFLTFWLMKFNGTKEEGKAASDPIGEDWEICFIEAVTKEISPPGLPEGANFNGLAQRSFDDEITAVVQSNFALFALGFALIFVYSALVLGRFNIVQQRVVLSVCGITVIGLAVVGSFGICFYMGFFVADMHPIIPFLLLGIGVDDMFVIVQEIYLGIIIISAKSLENLPDSVKSLSLPEKIGMTLKHAGVSITVTSITDMAAFFIGSTSSLPILRHFCLFTAFGVLYLYIFASTFFVGCLALDEKRISERRVISCMKPVSDSWTPNSFSQRDNVKIFFDKYLSRYLLKFPVKIFAITATLTLFGVGIWGATLLETNYNPIWYLRENSYQRQFFDSMLKYFPNDGEKVDFYIGDISYWNHLDELMDVYVAIAESSYLREGSISYWYYDFYYKYCDVSSSSSHFQTLGEIQQLNRNCSNELYFKSAFVVFLNESRKYLLDFKFNISDQVENVEDLIQNGFDITASRGQFQHSYLPNTTIQNTAMQEIKDSMAAIVFEGEDFRSPITYCFSYLNWEANVAISKELVRNLSLTFCTVVLVTLFLVANIRVSLFVLLCVVFTVINVAGYSHFLGLTIEIVTSINLILSCGLALDYAAHIGVAYICAKNGNRNERASESLVTMGAAVFHGGFSTFTTFALLVASDSYIFVTFFKMFTLVVVFGLSHGLIFLPVILSLIGPLPHFEGDEKKLSKSSSL